MEQMVQIYKALSEEMRLRILMLLTHGELCVCNLMDIFGETQSKISRHIAYLKHSGLVKGKRVGVWMHYSLKEPLDEVSRAQIDFMIENLSHLTWAKEDLLKMEEAKNRNSCEDQDNKSASPKKNQPPPQGCKG